MTLSYVELISIGFPAVQVHCIGDAYNYDNLVWDGGAPMPTKEVLDAWAIANPNATLSQNKKITVYALRQRFSMAEKIAIELSAIDNPSIDAEHRQLAAFLRVVLEDLKTATYVDLDSPDAFTLISTLEQFGLIGQGRANEIINTPVQPIELADPRAYS